MNLGIDISQIVYQGTGVARFTAGLTNAILEFDKKNSWTFFFSSLRRSLDPEIEKKIVQKGQKLIKSKFPPTVLSFLIYDLRFFSQYLISNIKYLNSLDMFITSDWIEIPLSIKKATIVHDLVYLRYPETVDKKILRAQQKRSELVKKESNLIFADSERTKSDLIQLLEIDSKKIIVNYPGVEVKKSTKEQINLTLKKYNLKRPFILTVGKLEPRKNLERLSEAMKQLNNETIDLVIVGPKGWGNKNIKYQMSNVKYLGIVSDQNLFSLYASCLFFILPSLYEGFGYPVIEAMKLGAPVATSNTSSLKEIAQDAALLFNPESVNEISQSIARLIKDQDLRKELIKKGRERSKMFTWNKYYQNLIKILSGSF